MAMIDAADIDRRLRALERAMERINTPDDLPVHAIYDTNAGQSLASGGDDQIINYGTPVYDPGDLVTTGASWACRCPLPGLYLVVATALLSQDAGWGGTETAYTRIYINDTASMYLSRQPRPSLDGHADIGGVGIVRVSVGDTLNVRAFQNSGGSISLVNIAAYNRIMICRLYG